MKILFLSRWFPFPIDNGSKIRIYNLLHGLSQHHEVTLLSFADQQGLNLESPEIRAICSNVHIVPWRDFDSGTARAQLGMFSLKPRSIVDIFSPKMAEAITCTLNNDKYDLILASQLPMAAYYPYFQGVTAIFEEIEIGLFHDRAFLPDGRIHLRHALTWFKLLKYLSRLLGSFSQCTVVSERENRLLATHFPKHKGMISMVPNCLSLEKYQGLNTAPTSNQLIFSGPFRYHVNYEAMIWFIEKVYPKIIKEIPETRLVITGDHSGFQLPPAPNVILTGHVSDIKSLIASSKVSIAPLLSGGGTRLKILEAMALGVPVVATSKGAEGLDVVSGQHLLVADKPDDFADQVIQLLQNADLHRQISANGKQLISEKYDWQVVMPHFLGILEKATG